jgi:hypothetical protein
MTSLFNYHYQLHLAFHNCLPYLKCRPPTNEEVTSLLFLVKASGIDWARTTYDNELTDIIAFDDASTDTVHCSSFTVIVLWQLILHRRNLSYLMHRYPEYLDVDDDFMDAHNPDFFNRIYTVQAL